MLLKVNETDFDMETIVCWYFLYLYLIWLDYNIPDWRRSGCCEIELKSIIECYLSTFGIHFGHSTHSHLDSHCWLGKAKSINLIALGQVCIQTTFAHYFYWPYYFCLALKDVYTITVFQVIVFVIIFLNTYLYFNMMYSF